MRVRKESDQPLRSFAVEIEVVNKFRPVSEQMDGSEAGDKASQITNESEDKGGDHKAKRMKLGGQDSEQDEAPRWSNPDPYAEASPLAKTTGKAIDIMNIIRRARIEVTPVGHPQGEEEENGVASNADFICFDTKSEQAEKAAMTGDPVTEQDIAGLALQGKRGIDDRNDLPGSSHQNAELVHPLPANPLLQEDRNSRLMRRQAGRRIDRPGEYTLDDSADEYCLSDDSESISIPDALDEEPRSTKLHKLPTTSKWKKRPDMPDMPWLDHPTLPVRQDVTLGTPSHRLHKEVCAFSTYTKPTPIETQLRADLVQNLDFTLQVHHPGARLLSFGSYAANLYLPDSDMDLVLVSTTMLHHGFPALRPKQSAYKLQGPLRRIAAPDSIQIIAKARVPLAKYTDAKTGIKVDLSFEQMNGVNAVGTLRIWLSEHPSLEPLVRVVKQFLAMRGMNEVFNGGLGGFSTICLVVAFLQNLPLTQLGGGGTLASHHLGDLLLWLLEFYGETFDWCNTAIVWERPPTVSGGPRAKFISIEDPRLRPAVPTEVLQRPRNSGRPMVLIDPNDSSNNLAYGSRCIKDVFEDFAEAAALLKERLAHVQATGDECYILEPILGGNYSSWIEARKHYCRLGSARVRRPTSSPFAGPGPSSLPAMNGFSQERRWGP